jgi:hypothetical protein
MELVRVSEIRHGIQTFVLANKLLRSKLDKLREQMSIPPKELNKLAKEVVGREFGDYRFLGQCEVEKVIRFLRKNQDVLGERYRRMRWGC